MNRTSPIILSNRLLSYNFSYTQSSTDCRNPELSR